MKRYAWPWRAIAWALAFVAGFVDVQGFLSVGGYFVSFLSGNSTRLGVALVNHSESAAKLGGILATFVLGAAIGSFSSVLPPRQQRSGILWFATALLVSSALLQRADYAYVGVCGLSVAMGALNGVFTDGREVTIGVTYMTGTLVKLGQRLGAAMRGAPLRDALPYLWHWFGLVAGGVAGTLGFHEFGANALWIPATVTAVLAVIASRLAAMRPEGG